MSEQLTVEQLEEQVAMLSPQEQLKLVAHISERLSSIPLAQVEDTEHERRREHGWQTFQEFIGSHPSGQPGNDFARKHDSYLYGKP